MEEASFVAAFAGGVLALLAPCSALLLPAFFAYAFANRVALVRGTVLFLCGLLTVLLPLGLAASLAGRLLVEHRQTTILVSGAALITLGALQATGARPPGAITAPLGNVVTQWQAQATGAAATYATGVVYGLTGFCSGPLLGGVLTLAATSQQPAIAAALLLLYGIGMAAPLFLLAAVWDRYHVGQKRWLRGRALTFRRWSVHSTNVVGGAVFVLLGASFIASQGGSLLSGVYDDLGLSALGFRLQAWLASTL